MDWDHMHPVTAEEALVFSQLHSKVTKFPGPSGIRKRPEASAAVPEPVIQDQVFPFLKEESKTMAEMESHFLRLKDLFERQEELAAAASEVLQGIEALCHIQTTIQSSSSDTTRRESLQSAECTAEIQKLEYELQAIDSKIAELKDFDAAIKTIQTCSLSSFCTAPKFIAAYRLVVANQGDSAANISNSSNDLTQAATDRAHFLMQKCWENGLAAAECVLDVDLKSVESYLDDPSYRQITDQILTPLAEAVQDPQLAAHFSSYYAQFRCNVLRSISDRFSAKSPFESAIQIVTDAIERARLMIQAERVEFARIFPFPDKTSLNKVLECVGNLQAALIDSAAGRLSPLERHQISMLITNLLATCPADDPFAILLTFLQEGHFASVSVNSISPAIMDV